jgi:hypothetical protein
MQTQQMFLITTESMATVFVYNTNTVITLFYEYVSLSADRLVMTVCIVLCLQLQDIVGPVAQSV